MAKKRITQIAEELGLDAERVLFYAENELQPDMISGKGLRTWVNEEGQEELQREFLIPEVITKIVKMKCLRPAQNPRFVFCFDESIGKKVPVMIKKGTQKQMIGKQIPVEIIEDESGMKSYRCPAKRFF